MSGCVLINDISDHLPVYCIWNDDTAVSDRNVMHSVSRRFIDDNKMFNFARQLSTVNWNVSDGDANMSYNNFISKFMGLYNLRFPVVTKKIKSE